MMDLAGMKVADLRKELKARGLPTVGTKQDLITRLEGVVEDKEEVGEKSATTAVVDDGLLDDEDDDDELLAGEDDSNESTTTTNAAKDLGSGAPIVTPLTTTTIPTTPSSPKKLKLNREPITTLSSTEEVKKIKTVVSDADRLKLREQKFGNVGKEAVDVLKKRNERFGIGGEVKTTQQPADPAKLEKRKQRFGEVLASTTDEKKLKRAQRFK